MSAAAIAAIASALGSAGDFASQMITNARNEKLMREGWSREDTAMQRRVADLKAAGLNPVLAAGGGGASSSAPIKLEAPKIGDSVSRSLTSAVAANQMSITRAEAARVEAEAMKSQVEAAEAAARWRALNKSSDLLPPQAGGMTVLEWKTLQEALKSQAQIESGLASATLSGTNAAKALYDLKLAKNYSDAQKIIDIISKSIGIFK